VKRYLCATIFLSVAQWLVAQEEKTFGHPSISPDKKWEYRASGESAVLVKAGSDETVVDLAEEVGYLAGETGKVVWAPDSRRFAFNTRKGGKYHGCDLYELRGTTWEKLPSLEDKAKSVAQMIERSAARRLKQLSRKKTQIAHPFKTEWSVRRWIDNATFEAYASDFQRVQTRGEEDWVFVGASVLFQAKCDSRRGWKITTTRLLSDAEDEDEQIREDELR
jgi:hypothetical protein